MRYQIITFSYEYGGSDEKETYNTMKEARNGAKKYLKEGYDYVYIDEPGKYRIMSVYDEFHRQGRHPWKQDIDRIISPGFYQQSYMKESKIA